ncbi:hypothetical protein GPROT1_00205 [Gammaproteobacteria bacterium]|nr:hypothetical protein GPROT1_00205 [Gammaproteobacteria bacterium]
MVLDIYINDYTLPCVFGKIAVGIFISSAAVYLISLVCHESAKHGITKHSGNSKNHYFHIGLAILISIIIDCNLII